MARGALWITLFALLTSGVALSVQYVQTVRLLTRQNQALVNDEAASLVAQYDSRGIDGLSALLERQQNLPRINEFFYLITAPDGAHLVGNLATWPQTVTETGFHSFRTEVVNSRGQSRSRQVDAEAVMLDDGYRLLVGSFADDRIALQQRYLQGLFGSLLATALLGLAFGWWYSRRGLSFVEAASESGELFLNGRLDRRLPVTGRADEYDRLAVTINRCFAEVERLVDSLRATTDGMAHDLKTPLTRLRARLELAEMRADLEGHDQTGGARFALEECREDVDQLLQLIDNILDLAHAEATSATRFVDVDLADIAREAVELYAPVAEDKAVSLKANLAAAHVSGAPVLLGQLIANLVDNAVKYTPPGGAVEVSVSRAAGIARLVVADSGPGIPIERRDEVLGRFARLDESRSRPGAGMGLSVVDVATRVHNGKLILGDNRPGLRVEVRLASVGPPFADNRAATSIETSIMASDGSPARAL